MQQLVLIETPQQLARTSTVAVLPAMDPDVVARDRPDSHWAFIDDDGQIMGRCSLWWQNTPAYYEDRIGVIGHYAVSDSWAAHRVLQHACQELATKGCTMAVGPMDGNTWRRYRLVTERGCEPTFFLEPDNPDEWPTHYMNAGFQPLAEYTSALSTDLSHKDSRMDRVAQRTADMGVTIRQLSLERFEEELSAVYAVTVVAFARNFLYTPISQRRFFDLYRPIRPYVRPELVLVAEHNSRPVGFIFGLPDLNQARRGQPIDTVIIKSLAVLPGRLYAGLGSLLIQQCHQAAHGLGFTRAIHALMHESHISRNVSARHASIFRRYALYARNLSDEHRAAHPAVHGKHILAGIKAG